MFGSLLGLKQTSSVSYSSLSHLHCRDHNGQWPGWLFCAARLEGASTWQCCRHSPLLHSNLSTKAWYWVHSRLICGSLHTNHASDHHTASCAHFQRLVPGVHKGKRILKKIQSNPGTLKLQLLISLFIEISMVVQADRLFT